MDVLYTIETDGLGHVFFKNGDGEVVASFDDNPDWSESHRADVAGETLRRAMSDEY